MTNDPSGSCTTSTGRPARDDDTHAAGACSSSSCVWTHSGTGAAPNSSHARRRTRPWASPPAAHAWQCPPPAALTTLTVRRRVLVGFGGRRLLVTHLVAVQPPGEEGSVRSHGGFGGGVQHHAHYAAGVPRQATAHGGSGWGAWGGAGASRRAAGDEQKEQPPHHTTRVCSPVSDRLGSVPAAVLGDEDAAVVGVWELGLGSPTVKGEAQGGDVRAQRLGSELHLGRRA